MKKYYYLFASLTLGLLVASCQNGLEEVINESEVQDELATTRAEEDEPADDIQAAELRARDVGLDISGYRIISGTSEVTYTVSATSINVSNYYIEWIYDSGVLNKTAGSNGLGCTSIKLKLLSSSNTSDTYLTVNLRNSSTGPVQYATTIAIGCNGPLAGTSSIRIERASDGLQVYPSNPYIGLRPNTYYYAYFSNTMTSNMDLQWDFYDYATVIWDYDYSACFLTDYNGWTRLKVSGKMAGSSVYKEMLDIYVYGYEDSISEDEDEDEEESEKQGENDN